MNSKTTRRHELKGDGRRGRESRRAANTKEGSWNRVSAFRVKALLERQPPAKDLTTDEPLSRDIQYIRHRGEWAWVSDSEQWKHTTSGTDYIVFVDVEFTRRAEMGPGGGYWSGRGNGKLVAQLKGKPTIPDNMLPIRFDDTNGRFICGTTKNVRHADYLVLGPKGFAMAIVKPKG